MRLVPAWPRYDAHYSNGLFPHISLGRYNHKHRNTTKTFGSTTHPGIETAGPTQDYSSSEDASIDTSSSSSSIGAPSSSSSSSLPLFRPLGPSVSGFTPFAPASEGFTDVVVLDGAGVIAEGGALNIDCCSSVDVTAAVAAVGRR